MPRLSLSLLGPLQVVLDGVSVTSFATDKTRALLVYLAVEADHPHRRDTLAGLLWPDQPQKKARQNLRQTLSYLRQALGEDSSCGIPFLLIKRETIQFNPDCSYQIDVSRFTALAEECNQHRHRCPEMCLPCLHRLAEMIELYQGEFLEQFFLNDSEVFEEWATLKREWLHREAVEALLHLSDHCERCGDYKKARQYAQRQVSLEPWREKAHRQLMRLLALDGQRSAALAQYETCCRALAEELGVEPTEETQALYETIRAEKQGSRGIEKTVPSHNLPISSTTFVGRAKELGEITEILANPDCRLLTLFGPGGIGKTRLALRTAADHLGVFEDGIAFAPLAPIDSAEHFIPAVASGLGISLQGEQEPKELLLNYLRQKELLLVLDNVEHILGCTDLISTMLQRSPGLVLLVTSRERLNLQEEWVYKVEGLSYPRNGAAEDVEGYSAIRLFQQSARRARQDFVLAEPVIPYVVRICQLVEGMPLAIELAAAETAVCSLRDIAQDIEHNLDVLSTVTRNIPERHRSVRATFEHSWNLLAEQEQQVFAKLSVFQGGFERQAAQQVAEASQVILTTLIHKSLLRCDATGRYQIHQLLRQFAAEKLAKLFPHTDTIFHRHAAYYAAFLQQREDALKGGRQREALEEIAAEIDNVRHAWQWAVSQVKNGPNETWALAVLEQAAESLCLFYTTRDRYQEGKEAFSQAVSALDSDLASGQRELLLGRLLAYQGKCCEFTERSDKAPPLFERSLEIFQRLGARREAALSLHGLGYMAHIRGEYEQAERCFQDSMAIYSKMEDAWGIANVLNNLCLVERRRGAFLQAKQHAQEALAIRREIGDKVGAASALSGLGLVQCDLGEYAEAKNVLLEALGLFRQFDRKVGIADTLTSLCQATFRLGETEAAQQFGQQSLQVYQEIGDHWGVAIAFNNLGRMAAETGDYVQAKRLYQEGVALYQQIGIKAGWANTLGNLGEACYELGDYAGARRYVLQALQIAQEIGANPTILKNLVCLATLWAQEGKTAQGLELLAFATHQSAIAQEIKKQALLLSAELAAGLPADVVAEAKARGRACELDALMAEILGDEDISALPSPANTRLSS
jgi:predicted ATPase/DNA-binding SARP family transcriptional activator